jgi:hypothetical protein
LGEANPCAPLPLVDGYRYRIEEVFGEELGSPHHEEHQPDSESSRPEDGRHARSQVSLDVGGDDSQRHDPEHDGDPGDETGGCLLERGHSQPAATLLLGPGVDLLGSGAVSHRPLRPARFQRPSASEAG